MTDVCRAKRPFRPALPLAAALLAATALAGCQKPAPPGAVASGDADYALKVLADAPSQGFAPGAFGEQPLVRHEVKDRAERDRRLHAALVAYAEAEHGLSIPKSAFPQEWGVRPPAYDAEADLTRAVAEHRFKAWLDALPPPSPTYRTLQAAYVNYLKLIAAGGWPQVPDGQALRQGSRDPRVAALRQRLAAEDPALAGQPAEPVFDATLAGAVQRFQTASGLQPTGVVDAETLAALNVPAQARAGQIRANLERLRWLPREDPPTRIDVNTAAATMDYFRDGQPAMHMLAASGKPGDETPMLTSAISAIVLNPPWNVPDGIAKEEILPKGEEYLASHNFTQVSDGEGGGRLVQQPGPESALGLVKFEFPNPYSVYLHDTPSKAAFNRSQRAVSHGCVRLQAAVPLAKLIVSQDSDWTPERVDQTIASHETTTVKLKQKIPVRLMYLTAFPEAGRIAFRTDIYGWDPKLLELLDAPRKAPGQQARVGAGA